MSGSDDAGRGCDVYEDDYTDGDAGGIDHIDDGDATGCGGGVGIGVNGGKCWWC